MELAGLQLKELDKAYNKNFSIFFYKYNKKPLQIGGVNLLVIKLYKFIYPNHCVLSQVTAALPVAVGFPSEIAVKAATQ
mgnify:CR=1 FL=1